MLESDLKKHKIQVQKREDENKKLQGELEEIQKHYEKKLEKMEVEKYFKESERTKREFEESCFSQIDRSSAILNQTISTTTYQLKKQSPKKNLIRKEAVTSSTIQIPKFNIDENTTNDNEAALFEDDDDHINDDEEIYDEDIVIPDTQLTSTVHNELIKNKTEFELSVLPPTQLDNETVYFKETKQENILIESDDEIPGTQFVIPDTQPATTSTESNKQQQKQHFKKSRSKESLTDKLSSSELKRIKTQQIQLIQDDAIKHQMRFKFIDFQVYDNLYEEKRINYLKENVNSLFDQIIEKIINSNLRSQLNNFEFKFAKLNEQFILTLINLDLKTNLPELTFNLLANLKRYHSHLEDKQLLSKLTNKCFILDPSFCGTYLDEHKDYARKF